MTTLEQKKTWGINIEIVTTFDSLDEKSILDPKNEAVELIRRFLTFKHDILVRHKNIFAKQCLKNNIIYCYSKIFVGVPPSFGKHTLKPSETDGFLNLFF